MSRRLLRLLGVAALLCGAGLLAVNGPAHARQPVPLTAAAPDDTREFRGFKDSFVATGYLFLSADRVYDKPIVIPTPFDPFERQRPLTIDVLAGLFGPFVDPARALGYDIWIVQTNSGQNIHEQAAEFAQAIEHAAARLGAGGQVVVGAYSLGGVTARVTTARWEDPGQAAWRAGLGLRDQLPVKMIVFGDAPLQGANVNLDLQKAIWLFGKEGDFNLDSCAAQQLLRFSEGGHQPDLLPGQNPHARNFQKFYEEGNTEIRIRGHSPGADRYEGSAESTVSICDGGPAVYRSNGDGWAHRPRTIAFSDGMPGRTQCYGDTRDHNRAGRSVCPRFPAPFVPRVGDAMYRIQVPILPDFNARAAAGDLDGGSRLSTILDQRQCAVLGLLCGGVTQYFTGAFIPYSSAVPAGGPFHQTKHNEFHGVHAVGYPLLVNWVLGHLVELDG